MANKNCFICGVTKDEDYLLLRDTKYFCSEDHYALYYTVNNTKITIPQIEVSGGLTNSELRAAPLQVIPQPLAATKVMLTGALVTTAVTANQVILTYTVTTGKTFYLQYLKIDTRLTTFAATATNFGLASLENPALTKLITQMQSGAGITIGLQYAFNDLTIASGTVIRVVCTPNAATSYTWQANIGGYEL